MKIIECPMKLALKSVELPKKTIFDQNKARNQILYRIYGHLIYGFTQQNPKEYYQKFNINIEGRLMSRIQGWAEQMRYQNQTKIKMNIQEKNDNNLISYFFPDDQNIGWIYDENNIGLKILNSKIISGVYIEREKNLEKKYYSQLESKGSIQYKLSAKHIAQPPKGQTFYQYQIEFIANRFIQNEGQTEEGYKQHILQIETLTGYRFFEKMSHYYITDVDNCLEGNPLLLQ